MSVVEQLYRDNHRFVWRSLRRMGVPCDGLEDALQEVFTVAARRLQEFEGRSSVKTWLFAIALGIARNDRRTRERRNRRMHAIADVHRTHVAAPAPADDRLELMDLLMTLDEQQRAIVVLVELEGMTGQEAAAALGLSMHGVYRRLDKARRLLEKRLAELPERMPAAVLAERGGAQWTV